MTERKAQKDQTMTSALPANLTHFSIHDLRKIARHVGTKTSSTINRDQLIDLLNNESPSLLGPAMFVVMNSDTLGEPDPLDHLDPEADHLDPFEAQNYHTKNKNTLTSSDSASVDELKKMVKQTQEGVARFAEDVDARVERIEQLATRLIEHEPLRIVIEHQSSNPDEAPKVVLAGSAHREFPTLLTMAQAKVNILMVGPAGSGKTTAAEQLSRALNIPFRFNGAIDTEYKLKGFVDAQGRVVNTAFREAFEHGGVYLFDEVDASLPAATMAFNAALANGWCDFPDKRVERHPDTIIIAAANTFLGGATFEYVGRNKQDAAFIDRFLTLTWDIDEALESALCPHQAWCKHVQRIRANAKKKGLKVIVSPRASIEGAKLLAKGLPWEFVEKAAIRKGMTEDQWNQVK